MREPGLDARSARGDLLSDVSARLAFNVRAYGKVWSGEDEDTAFICAPLVDALAEKDREIERKDAEIARLRRALNGDFDA